MSLYNMICGVDPACFYLLPMLGRVAEDYPRFRDCFLSEDGDHIDIYTRVGGNNRNCGYGEEELYKDENFVETFDDSFDNTFATYRFKVPEKWKKDFEYIKQGEYSKVSDEYVEHTRAFFPKLNKEGVIDRIYRGADK